MTPQEFADWWNAHPRPYPALKSQGISQLAHRRLRKACLDAGIPLKECRGRPRRFNDEQLLDMFERGYGACRIARDLGCSLWIVHNHKRRLGLYSRQQQQERT